MKILILLLFWVCCGSEPDNEPWWLDKADKMVINQIERRGVQEAGVLRAMRETPRHIFIPSHLKSRAYNDSPLPIGEGQTISQPYIVALMTELLRLSGKEKVLEIGTGSGYQAAVLSVLTQEVYTIEIVQSLAESAMERLKKLGYDNVLVKWGDGYQGWTEHAPFDRIIVTAAPDQLPSALIDQLKIGGYLVIPVGTYYQQLKVITKLNENQIEEENIIPVRFVPMVHPKDSIPDKGLEVER